jgi:hypothetical protein
MNRTTLVLAFFVAAVAAGFVLRANPPAEHFMQKDAGMPLDAPGMGPYDQGVLGSGWAKTEMMPVGTQPVGQAMDANKLMFLVGNKTDPSCCPAAFTTDSGCVCLSGKDTDLMNRRGGNK